MKKNDEIMVSVECLAYNQVSYIRQTLEGFVSQKTNFKFEVIVHDDASTDGTSNIIREYAEKYPDIIIPIIETENLYSKHDGSLTKVIEPYLRGKYVAYCEGDDYWCDSLKLQTQFDFMESHPKNTLCFHAHRNLYNDGSFVDQHVYNKDKAVCPIKDIILGGGGFMATNSMFYKRSCRDDYPMWAKKAPVSDFAWMLVFSSYGNVGYIDKVLSVYRCMAKGSWMSRIKGDVKSFYNHNKAIRKMFIDYNKWNNGKYLKYVFRRQLINELSTIKRIIISILS